VWLGVIAYAIKFYLQADIPLAEYPERVREYLAQYGAWGPILYMFIYAIRPIVFFPATILTAASGLIFGPIYGILYTIIGENLSANFAFLIGRYFGRDFVKDHEHGMLKHLDRSFKENGFITVLLMRLLYFPFDLTNYLSGLSGVRHRDYALATFIGIIPGLTTFVLLGSSFASPINLVMTGVVFFVGLAISFRLKKKHSHFAAIKNMFK
jgi:uncharacterized membrane protein YdjX (TVP38/TMEM64 family)